MVDRVLARLVLAQLRPDAASTRETERLVT